MSEGKGRYQHPDTGEWADDRRAGMVHVLSEDVHKRLNAMDANIDAKLKEHSDTIKNSIKLWLALAVITIGVAFVLPVMDKVYGQSAIDTAQNERIVANSVAIVALRETMERHRTELRASIDRRFDANEKRLDRLDAKLDKIFERVTAQNDPNDRRGVVLPEKEAMR